MSLHRSNSIKTLIKVLTLSTLISFVGCFKDYSQTNERVDSATTLSIEEEDRLISQGQAVLEKMNLNDVSDPANAAKSVEQTRASQKSKLESLEIDSDPLPDEPWIAASKLPLEKWEIQYYKNQPLGYIHQRFKVGTNSTADRIFIEADSVQNLQKDGSLIEQTLDMLVGEGPSGNLKSVDYKLIQDSAETTVKAVVVSNDLRVTTKSNGQTSQRSIVWNPSIRGPFADEQSMMHKPMQTGEVRKLLIFEPSVGDVVKIQLTARGLTNVAVANGTVEGLMEVDRLLTHNQLELHQTLWVDPLGIIKKRFYGYAGLISMTTGEATAKSIQNAAAIEPLKNSMAKLPRPILDLKQRTKLNVRVTCVQQDPYKAFTSNSRQHIASISAITADVEVQQINVAEVLSQQEDTVVIESELGERLSAKTPYLDFENSAIQGLVKNVMDENDQSRPLPLLLADAIHESHKLVGFENKMRPASAAMSLSQCDSVGFAFMLCAAARAADMPARVASGLIYNENETTPGFVFHMWTEIRHQNRWIAVDATRPGGELSVATMRISDSELADRNPYESVWPVFELLPTLELEVR